MTCTTIHQAVGATISGLRSAAKLSRRGTRRVATQSHSVALLEQGTGASYSPERRQQEVDTFRVIDRRSFLALGITAAVSGPAQGAHATTSSTAGEKVYVDATLALLRTTAALLDGTSDDVIAWIGETDRWAAAAKGNYNAKTQGKSFLMTTKLVAYMKNSLARLDGAQLSADAPPYNVEKAREWLSYADGFTTGELSGKAARIAYSQATWGNYDKNDNLNRIGLCAFGETLGTKALGVNCDGF